MDVKLKIQCEYCEKIFVRYIKTKRANSFCSRECYHKSRIGESIDWKRSKKELKLIVCSYCSQPIERWTYQLKESKKHFCNSKCKGKWQSLHCFGEKAFNWKGGIYSTIARILSNARYVRIKRMVLVMDKNICQLCESNERLEVHHIIEKGKNPALIYDITNLITLCKKCHCGIHGHEEDYVGIFDGIVANRMNCGKPRTGNPQPSSQSEKVQRLLEHSDMLNNQLERPARKG